MGAQRMGRIHRYGQEYEVQVVNLVANTTREGAVMVRVMHKLESMREALGHDQVYDVISSVLEGGQVRLETLIREAILKRRSMEDILADLEFVDSASSVAAARDALGEALSTSHIDMALILGDQRESKERRLTPEFVERFLADGFRYMGARLSAGPDPNNGSHVPAAAVSFRRRARRRRRGRRRGPGRRAARRCRRSARAGPDRRRGRRRCRPCCCPRAWPGRSRGPPGPGPKPGPFRSRSFRL